jgi:predicted peptidase
MKSLLTLLVASFVGVHVLVAQDYETGFLNRTVTVGRALSRYQVYVPHSYDPASSWPVILFLHGAGERGADGLIQTEVGLGPAIRRFPERYPAIVVFPQAPKDSLWQGASAQMAMAALEQTIREYSADVRRLYLTGLSMGGHGSWYLSYHHPDRFAAVAPICGWVYAVG